MKMIKTMKPLSIKLVTMLLERTTILIEDAILKTAQEIGLNVPQYCENALKIAIEALRNGSEWRWAGPDLNRRPFGYQPNAPTKLSYRPLNLTIQFLLKDFSL